MVFIVRQTQVLAYFAFATSVAQFRIAGYTVARCIKTHQSEAKAVKEWVDESSRSGGTLQLCFELHH